MSEPASADPSAQIPPTATPPAATSEPEIPAAPAASDTPPWLPERIKQARQSERKSIFEPLGVKDIGELKTKLAQLSELETAQLSEKERTAKLIDELKPKAEQLGRVSELFGQVVEAQFSQLPEQIREAIDARANGDAEKRWDLMQVMTTAGVLGNQPAAASPSQPKPAQTAPAAPPPPASPADPKTPYDKWQALHAQDPMAASVFYQLNSASIEQSRKA